MPIAAPVFRRTRPEKVKPDDALEVRVLPATLGDVREKLLGEQGLSGYT